MLFPIFTDLPEILTGVLSVIYVGTAVIAFIAGLAIIDGGIQRYKEFRSNDEVYEIKIGFAVIGLAIITLLSGPIGIGIIFLAKVVIPIVKGVYIIWDDWRSK